MTKFNCIYCDPPYEFRNKNTGGSHKSGSANKYPVISLKEIEKLSFYIDMIKDKDCVLFLWVPSTMNREALRIIDAWGFNFKSKIYWLKKYPGRQMGMGFWFRNCIEELWICTSGNVKPFGVQQHNVFLNKVLKHSEKPVKFRRIIELITSTRGYDKRLELFARKEYKKWTSIGYDVDGMDIKKSLLLQANPVTQSGH